VGLETTHDCWHGSYMAFGEWRQLVARVAGYTMKDHSDVPWTTVDLPWEMFTQQNHMGEWTNGPAVEDPLLYLIVHSDCEGVIHPKEGRHLAARLEQILPTLTIEGAPDFPARLEQFIPGLTAGRLTDEWLEEATKRFIKGLRVAAEAGEDVVFF
jgi:hypothetical protein